MRLSLIIGQDIMLIHFAILDLGQFYSVVFWLFHFSNIQPNSKIFSRFLTCIKIYAIIMLSSMDRYKTI